ncbi:MAG: nitrogen regulatory protein PII-like uncharacterized protein [Marinobacter maritimus]|jgi:nitrogen regulatory protein PII-like uncharacterized protein
MNVYWMIMSEALPFHSKTMKKLSSKSVAIGTDFVEINDEKNKYILDMKRVGKEDINELEERLKKMNFDNRFTIIRI